MEPPSNHGIYRWYMAPKITLWIPKQRIYMFNQLNSCGNQAVFVDIQSWSFQGSSIYRFNHSQEDKSVWRRWKFPMFWGAQRYARRSEEVQTGEDPVFLHRCQIEEKTQRNSHLVWEIYLFAEVVWGFTDMEDGRSLHGSLSWWFVPPDLQQLVWLL